MAGATMRFPADFWRDQSSSSSSSSSSSFSSKSRRMQIKLKCSCGEGKCPEWAIIELQGVVEAHPCFQDRLQNLQIGTLCRPSGQEVYTFTVGYHELTGTKVALKKPFLLWKKKKCEDLEQSSETNSGEVELEVIGVIRHRILFKTRPKAIISKPQPLMKRAPAPDSAIQNQSE